MDNQSYMEVYVKAVKAISAGHYDSALALLKGKESIKNIELYRVFYRLFSDKKSPVCNREKAIQRLDGLCSFSDPWGLAEKGRCLLHGVLYPSDTFEAEDHLVLAGDDQAQAIYYRAEIHFNGLHIDDDGEQVFDYKEAEKLYKLLIDSSNDKKYQKKARLQYCRLLMKRGDLSTKDKCTIHDFLVVLCSESEPNALEVYAEFLVESFKQVMVSVFDEGDIPEDHEGKISMETRRRDCRKALASMQKSIKGDEE